jgi:hypothetical protein
MTEKALTLASLNVKGLRGNSTKPKEIKVWLASLPTPPQIILFEEHHLGKESRPPQRASNSGKGTPSGMKAYPWDARKEQAPAWPF